MEDLRPSTTLWTPSTQGFAAPSVPRSRLEGARAMRLNHCFNRSDMVAAKALEGWDPHRRRARGNPAACLHTGPRMPPAHVRYLPLENCSNCSAKACQSCRLTMCSEAAAIGNLPPIKDQCHVSELQRRGGASWSVGIGLGSLGTMSLWGPGSCSFVPPSIGEVPSQGQRSRPKSSPPR